MKIITFVTEIAQAGNTRYIPVPYRGTIKSIRLGCDAVMVADKTVIFSRGATAVNTVTADDEAAGTILDGVPDTTNKGLVFDPDSDTATYQVIKMVSLAAFVAAAATLTVRIEFDDSAYIEQTASEA
jgi:hypothetical protein